MNFYKYNVCLFTSFSFRVVKVYFPGISNKLHINNKKCPGSILYLSKDSVLLSFPYNMILLSKTTFPRHEIPTYI